MIRNILVFALQQRWMVIIITALMAIYGALVYERLPVQAFPDVQNVYVVVISQYPNQSAEEVEKLVSMPIERAINGVPHLMHVRSVSTYGLSVVTATFNDDAEDYFSRQQVLERLKQADLPVGVQPVLGPLTTGVGEIYRYVVHSDNLPLTEIRALQDWVIAPHIKTAPGVADVSSFGGQVKQYQVNLDPERLRSFGLSAGQVMDALAENNSNTGGGVLVSGEQAMVIRGIGLLQTLEDIAQVVVVNLNGTTPVRVRDVGRVEIGHQERTGIVGFNTEDDVSLGIVMMTKGGDAVKIIEGVKQRIDELNDVLLPPGTRIEMVNDRTKLVTHTVHTVTDNLLHGAALVVIILLVFLMRPIAALLVAIIIPLSLLFAFILMSLKGVSANLISLGAIDFGIIVDSTVVLVEAVMVKLTADMAQGASILHRRQTLVAVGTQMIRPIIFAKVILIAAFLPVLTFSQVEGKIFTPMALTLTFALLGSVLLTLFLVPAMMSFFLDHRLTERHNPVMEKVTRAYQRLLVYLLSVPKRVLTIALVLLVLSISMVKQLGTEFMPKFDEGNIWLTVVLPTSTSLQESKAVERQVRDVLMGFPEVKLVVSHLGRPEDGTDSKGFNSMEIHVELEPKETWRYSSKVALIEAIKEKVSVFSGLSFNFSQQIQASVEEAISGSQGEVVIKLYGLELAVMQEKANQIVSILNTINGSADVAAEQQMGAGEAQLIINRVKAAMYGLSVADVHKQIEVALGGGVATQILEGERRFDLQVRLQNEGRNSVAAMNDLLIPTENGQLIPLGEVADIVLKTGANRISRESNYRRIAIKSNLIDRDQGSFVKEAMKRVKDEVELPAGYRLVWSGEFENQQRAMQRLYVIVPISLLLIFALLFWAFKSAAQALLVMLTVPFAIAGGILLLWLLGVNLSISAAVGFIVLFGIAVQNGVVMMEYINYLRASGEDALLAIQEGAKARLRPVLMTALMAILGLLPAAVSTGVGAEATRPFALAIIGGLVTATLATLTLLPVIYWLWLRRQAAQKMA
ncbi:MAG: CusA/CzcA family heavy metal efflux RND transporter [Gammaproteobacteria bacterium]|nr:CusA/CzcA family heavy metal efflux RND transporter [Gammaproteobacteria bacterium]MCL4556284.1 CusA/CzcA family heavy metal efflux RND transporter [Gammaproteobacteria bacterium]